MRVNFSVGLEDYLALNKNKMENSTLSRKEERRIRWISTIVYLIILPVLVTRPDLKGFLWYIFLGVVFYTLVFPFFYTFLQYVGTRLSYKRAGLSITEKNYIIDEEGIYSETSNTKSLLKWEGILRASQDKDRYFIYISDNDAIIIKRKATNLSAQEQIVFNDLINRHIGQLIVQNQRYSPLSQKIRIGLLIILSFIYFFYLIQQEDPLNRQVVQAEKAVYELYEDSNHENIEDHLTQEHIDRAVDLVNSIQMKEFDWGIIEKIGELQRLIQDAQKQLDEKTKD